jgi:predicted transcriptional regulator
MPQYINITTEFSTLKLLLFSFSCLTIERSIVFKTMDRQCESFSRVFSSATGLENSLIFNRNIGTSSSIHENSTKKNSKFKKIQKISKFKKFQKKKSKFSRFQNHKISIFSKNLKNLNFHKIS